MSVSIAVFVTAPRGTRRMGNLLAALRGQLGLADRLVLLDGTERGPPPDSAMVPAVGAFEHVHRFGESAFQMRCTMRAMADRDVTVLFEDHVVPGPRFMAEIRRLFAADPALVAVKILGRNDTSNDAWGWTNFLIAFAECLHPAAAIPATLLSTTAAVRTTALAAAPRTVGAWETQVIPSFNREPRRLAYSNDVWIDHQDRSSLKHAMVGNFNNQRAIAALRVAHGHRRGKLAVRAFKDLGFRRADQIERALAGRDEHRHVVANRGKLVLVCWAAALGAIAGVWFGAGASMQKMD